MKIHGTAKGGALATKDFGVAFGAPTPTVQTCQGESYTGESAGLGSGYPSGEIMRVGMTPLANNTLIDTVANKFSLKIKLVGSLSSYSIGARIYDDADPPVEQAQSINTISDVTTSFEFRQFEFTSDFIVKVNYYYVIYQASGTFDGSDRIDIQMNASSADNNSMVYYTDDNVWYPTWFGQYKPCAICFTG